MYSPSHLVVLKQGYLNLSVMRICLIILYMSGVISVASASDNDEYLLQKIVALEERLV